MASITFQDVQNGVLAGLVHAFPDIPVVVGEIGEGASPPCIAMRLLEAAHTHEQGRRYMRRHIVAIQYYPSSGSQDDMNAAAERLTDALEWIAVGERTVRGAKMRFEIAGGMLRFYAEYGMHVWRPAHNDPTMQTLKQGGNVK